MLTSQDEFFIVNLEKEEVTTIPVQYNPDQDKIISYKDRFIILTPRSPEHFGTHPSLIIKSDAIFQNKFVLTGSSKSDKALFVFMKNDGLILYALYDDGEEILDIPDKNLEFIRKTPPIIIGDTLYVQLKEEEEDPSYYTFRITKGKKITNITPEGKSLNLNAIIENRDSLLLLYSDSENHKLSIDAYDRNDSQSVEVVRENISTPKFKDNHFKIKDKIYFNGDNYEYGGEPYTLDLNTYEVSLLKDINKHSFSSSPRCFTYLSNSETMIFQAADKFSGRQFYAYFLGLIGTEDQEINNSLSLYPNPSQDIIKLDRPLSHVKIHDIGGRSVRTMIKVAVDHLDISYLPAGVYIITGIDERGQSVTGKFVKI